MTIRTVHVPTIDRGALLRLKDLRMVFQLLPTVAFVARFSVFALAVVIELVLVFGLPIRTLNRLVVVEIW